MFPAYNSFTIRKLSVADAPPNCTTLDAVARLLSERLVRTTAGVFRAVAEDVVDDHADDGEQEDDEAPQNLGARGTVRL